MPLYRSNTPSCSQVEVAALTTEPPESLNPELQNENDIAFLKPTTAHKDDPKLLLNKAIKKRSGMGVAVRIPLNNYQFDVLENVLTPR
jgi:hypothetical protein